MRKWSTQVSTVVVNVGRELSLLKMAINMAKADYPSFFLWNELEPRCQQRAAGSLELACHQRGLGDPFHRWIDRHCFENDISKRYESSLITAIYCTYLWGRQLGWNRLYIDATPFTYYVRNVTYYEYIIIEKPPALTRGYYEILSLSTWSEVALPDYFWLQIQAFIR